VKIAENFIIAANLVFASALNLGMIPWFKPERFTMPVSNVDSLRAEVAVLRTELERRLTALNFLVSERAAGRTPSKAARAEADNRRAGIVPASKVEAAFLAASKELQAEEDKLVAAVKAAEDAEATKRLRLETALRREASHQRPVCEPGKPKRLDGPQVKEAGNKDSQKASGLQDLLKGKALAAK